MDAKANVTQLPQISLFFFYHSLHTLLCIVFSSVLVPAFITKVRILSTQFSKMLISPNQNQCFPTWSPARHPFRTLTAPTCPIYLFFFYFQHTMKWTYIVHNFGKFWAVFQSAWVSKNISLMFNSVSWHVLIHVSVVFFWCSAVLLIRVCYLHHAWGASDLIWDLSCYCQLLWPFVS